MITAPRVYEADADVLVTPVQSVDPVAGLGPIVESSDPTLAVETASQLISTPSVAEATIRELGPQAPTQDPQELLEQVSVATVSQSNILAVTAEEDSAEGAAPPRHDVRRAGVESRDIALQEKIAEKIPQLRKSLQALPEGSPESDQQAALLVELGSATRTPACRS